MTRDNVLDALSAHVGELKEDYHVRSLALFGSVVRNEGSGNSDVDLLVEFDQPIGPFHLVETQQRLENILSIGTWHDLPVQPVEQPIICNLYEEPRDHWVYDRQTGAASRGGQRRPAG